MNKEQQIQTYRELFQVLLDNIEFSDEEIELKITYKDNTTYTFNSKTGESISNELINNNIDTSFMEL